MSNRLSHDVWIKINCERIRHGMTWDKLATILGLGKESVYVWKRNGVPKNILAAVVTLFGGGLEFLADASQMQTLTSRQDTKRRETVAKIKAVFEGDGVTEEQCLDLLLAAEKTVRDHFCGEASKLHPGATR